MVRVSSPISPLEGGWCRDVYILEMIISIRAEIRMFLAFSVLLSWRFLATSLASGEAASRSMFPSVRRPVGGESW